MNNISSPRRPKRIIDAHQHAFWHGRDDSGLVADMDEHGIECSWLLTWDIAPSEDLPRYHRILDPRNIRHDGTHAGIPLASLLAARDLYPSRFVVGYCPHPSHSRAPDLLRAAVEMHGVRVCGEWKFRLLLDDPRCLEIFHAAGELKLPVILHLDVPYLFQAGARSYQPDWYGGTVENLERALKECPETIFVGHAPGFWREISGDAAFDSSAHSTTPVQPGGRIESLLGKYPNLHADLSANSALRALRRSPGYSVQLLTTFPDRFLFGRDCYGQELHHFLGTLGLSDDVVQNIYFKNAERLVPQ